MHLCLLAAPRTGAHMLRAMLADDASIADQGAPWHGGDSNAHRLVAGDFASARRFLAELDVLHEGRIALSQVKLGMGEHQEVLRAFEAANARFILLYREDVVAQIASFRLAAKYQAFRDPAPAGAKIALDPQHVYSETIRINKELAAAREFLDGKPHLSLVFEQLSDGGAVSAAVSDLVGREIRVGAATTRKSSPPVEAYVANLAGFRVSGRGL